MAHANGAGQPGFYHEVEYFVLPAQQPQDRTGAGCLIKRVRDPTPSSPPAPEEGSDYEEETRPTNGFHIVLQEEPQEVVLARLRNGCGVGMNEANATLCIVSQALNYCSLRATRLVFRGSSYYLDSVIEGQAVAPANIHEQMNGFEQVSHVRIPQSSVNVNARDLATTARDMDDGETDTDEE